MNCPTCGAQVSSFSSFCPSCGTAVTRSAEPAVAVGPFTRPSGITALAVLNFIGAALMLLVGASFVVAAAFTRGPDVTTIALGLGCMAFAVLYGATGVGLWLLKPFGRMLQIISAVFGLLGIPIGTIISILILVYLFNPGIRAVFSGKSRADLTADEVLAVNKVTAERSAVAIVLTSIVALLLMIPVVGIVAAIAIPGLLRARISGNEASAIGRIRAIISAEAAYSAASGGAYGTPDCLMRPAACISGYSGGTFISPDLLQREASGYRFTFHPLGSGEPEAREGGLTGFAFVAVPLQGGVSGKRAFCGDFTGEVCFVRDGYTPRVTNEGCRWCEPVR